MKTRLTELLEIRYPIIQGAMAWVSESTLVSAVANAGGTGVIACGGRTTKWIKDEIKKTKSLTDKLAAVDGDVENGLVQFGQSVSILNEIKPVKVVVNELIDETKTAIGRIQNLDLI